MKSHNWHIQHTMLLSPRSLYPPSYHVLSFTWAQSLLWPNYKIIAGLFRKAEVAHTQGVPPPSWAAAGINVARSWALQGNDQELNIQLCIFRARARPASVWTAGWLKSLLWVCECVGVRQKESVALRGNRQQWLWVLEGLAQWAVHKNLILHEEMSENL